MKAKYKTQYTDPLSKEERERLVKIMARPVSIKSTSWYWIIANRM